MKDIGEAAFQVVSGGKTEVWKLAEVKPFFSFYSYLGEARQIVAVEKPTPGCKTFGVLAWQFASRNGELVKIEDLDCASLEQLALAAATWGCLA